MKINQKQAAAHLGVKERTLEDYRLRGGGPPFYKIGSRVVYETTELDSWLAARRRTSTSDRGAAAPQAAASSPRRPFAHSPQEDKPS